MPIGKGVLDAQRKHSFHQSSHSKVDTTIKRSISHASISVIAPHSPGVSKLGNKFILWPYLTGDPPRSDVWNLSGAEAEHCVGLIWLDNRFRGPSCSS